MTDKATGLERDSLSVKGVRSELRLEGGQIQITKDATTQATPTSVTFQVAVVRGSTIETPKRGGRGWFHVATVNGSPAPVGELAASGDPYALPITMRQVGACRKLARLIDKHVKERGLPADVGPNQGRYTSGVVVQSGPRPATEAPETVPAPAAGTAATKPPVAGKPTAKKTAVKKSVAKRSTAAKKATAKRATAKKTTAKKPAASDLVSELRDLGQLHRDGILDDAEFAAAKAKILG